ncbi:MAG: RHS repeat protein [Chloroflexi bacterium]|nr:RHS repeat protein [Chloroflexota bacterium]
MGRSQSGRMARRRDSGLIRGVLRHRTGLLISVVLLGALTLALATGLLGSGDRAGASEHKPETSANAISRVPSTAAQSRTVAFSYDQAGRLVGTNYGAGNSISYAYDKAGNLLSEQTVSAHKLYLPMIVRDYAGGW